MPRWNALKAEEKIYIRANYQSQTVTEMSVALKRDSNTVYNFCSRNGLTPLGAKRGRKKMISPSRKPIGKKKVKVYDKPKEIIRFGKEEKPIVRPPAIYTNSPSPYGIASELHSHSSSKINNNETEVLQ